MSKASLRALEAVVQLNNASAFSHVFRAAYQAGIIASLSEAQKTLDEIAEECDIEASRLEIFLKVLCSVGLIEKYDDQFALAPVGRLIPQELSDLGERYWRHLDEWLSDGVSVPHNKSSTLDETDFLQNEFALEWTQTPAALKIAEKLEVGSQRKSMRILDIGGGGAVVSLTVAYRDPDSRLTLVDSPEALKRARKTIAEIGLTDRVEFVEAPNDRFELPEGPFDLVLLTNIAHRRSIEEVARLIDSSWSALKLHGEILLTDVFEGQPQGALSVALFALQLPLRFPAGSLHSADDIRNRLVASNFLEPEFFELEAPPWIYGSFLARKNDD